MTVAELIEFLKTQPQDLQVIYSCCSEHCLLEQDDMCVDRGCPPRPDGWVHDYRKDTPSQQYFMIP